MTDAMSEAMDTVRLSAIFANIAAARLAETVMQAKKIY